jgi:hypothetical protein
MIDLIAFIIIDWVHYRLASAPDRLTYQSEQADNVRLNMNRQNRHGIKIENVTPSPRCCQIERKLPTTANAEARNFNDLVYRSIA